MRGVQFLKFFLCNTVFQMPRQQQLLLVTTVFYSFTCIVKSAFSYFSVLYFHCINLFYFLISLISFRRPVDRAQFCLHHLRIGYVLHERMFQVFCVTVTEALVLCSLLEDRGRITESIRILVPVDKMKQNVFRSRWNKSVDRSSFSSVSSLFHARGAATEKALSPIRWRVCGMTRLPHDEYCIYDGVNGWAWLV